MIFLLRKMVDSFHCQLCIPARSHTYMNMTGLHKRIIPPIQSHYHGPFATLFLLLAVLQPTFISTENVSSSSMLKSAPNLQGGIMEHSKVHLFWRWAGRYMCNDSPIRQASSWHF
jgi:hypothetical protein